jgi:O-antigen/teichoic acid export membrane protein
MSLALKAFSILQRDVFLFVTNMATGIMVARVLGPAALGVWIILQFIPMYAESFGRLKFDVASVYFLGRGQYRVRDVVLTLNVLAGASSGVVIGLALLFWAPLQRLLFSEVDAEVGLLMTGMLVQIPLQFLYLNYSYIVLFRENIARYNIMVVGRALSFTALSFVLLLGLGWGLAGVVVASVASVGVGLLVGVRGVGELEPGPARIPGPLVRDLCAYGGQLYGVGLLGDLNASLTRFLTVLYLTPAQIAFFGMAQGHGQVLGRVPSALSAVLYPRLSKLTHGDAAELTVRAFRVTLLLLGAIGVVAAVLIRPAVHLLYGAAFIPTVVPFLIMLPGLVISSATTVFSQYFQGTARPLAMAQVGGVAVVAQLAGALLLLPRLGVTGAALAFLVGLVATAAVQTVLFLRLSGLQVHQLVVRRGDVRLVRDLLRRVRGNVRSKLTPAHDNTIH